MTAVRWAVAESVGGLPAAFWWLWLGTLVNRAGGFVLIFLAFYLTSELGYSAAFAGLVLGLFGLGSALAAVVGGVLADRIGRRPTILGAHLATSAVMASLALAQSKPVIAVGAFLLGLASNAVRPASSAMMADIVAPEDRSRAFALQYWAINLGFAVAPVLGGVLAGLGYETLFLVDAATTLVTALLVWAKVPESHPDGVVGLRRGAGEPATSGSLADVVRDRVFMSFLLLNFFVAFVFMQHVVTLPLAMERDGLSPTAYGAVMSVNGILIVLVTVPVSRWLQRFAPARVLALAAVLMGAGFASTALADTAAVYAMTVAVWTISEILGAPVSTTVVAELSPAALRGRYQGMFTLSWSAASAAAPVAGGWVFDRYGETALWSICGVVGLLCALGNLTLAGAREARLAELAAADHDAVTGVKAPPPREPEDAAVEQLAEGEPTTAPPPDRVASGATD